MLFRSAKAKEEYEYEREQFKPFKEGLEFVKTTGFAIIEENMRVRLRKIVDNCIIEIIYKVQSMEPTEFVDLDYEQRAAIMEKLEHEGKKTDDIQTTDFIKPSFPIIILLKDKKGSGLAFDCESKNEKFYIKSVAYNDNIEEYLKKILIKEEPGFDLAYCLNLTNDQKAGFGEYFENLGINNKLISFIKYHSTEKEEERYIDWLKDIENFTNTTQEFKV